MNASLPVTNRICGIVRKSPYPSVVNVTTLKYKQLQKPLTGLLYTATATLLKQKYSKLKANIIPPDVATIFKGFSP